jgi:hypothetical protein
MGRKAVSFLFYGISVVLTGLLLVAAVLCRYASSVSPGEGGFWATLALLMPVVLLANVVALVWWAVRRKWIVLLMPLAVLLQEGIGDTIRISLTPEPGAPRDKEVIVAQELLQTMGLRAFTPLVTACPGCGRTTSTFFQELAARIQSWLREQMPQWRQQYPGVETLNVAVMGCVVNGPGESKLADIGISLPGTGEVPVCPVYVDGEKTVTLKGEGIADEFQRIVADYVASRYGEGGPKRRKIVPIQPA